MHDKCTSNDRLTEKTNSLPPRLKSKLQIDQLFNGKDSKTATAYPLRAMFRETSADGNDAHLQVMFSVSKRHFKRAVKRNFVKRQMREALRLNKAVIADKNLDIAFIWLTDKLYTTQRVEQAMVKLLSKISERNAVNNS